MNPNTKKILTAALLSLILVLLFAALVVFLLYHLIPRGGNDVTGQETPTSIVIVVPSGTEHEEVEIGEIEYTYKDFSKFVCGNWLLVWIDARSGGGGESENEKEGESEREVMRGTISHELSLSSFSLCLGVIVQQDQLYLLSLYFYIFQLIVFLTVLTVISFPRARTNSGHHSRLPNFLN